MKFLKEITLPRFVVAIFAFAGLFMLLGTQYAMYVKFKSLFTANETISSCIRFLVPPAVFVCCISVCAIVILCRILVASLLKLREINDVGNLLYVLGFSITAVVISVLVMLYRFEPNYPLNELTEVYEGHEDVVDRIQRNMRCCGVNSYLDWSTHIQNRTLSDKQWWLDIPESCRRQERTCEGGDIFPPESPKKSLETWPSAELEDGKTFFLVPESLESLMCDGIQAGEIFPLPDSLETFHSDEHEDGDIFFRVPRSLEALIIDALVDDKNFALLPESFKTLLRDGLENGRKFYLLEPLGDPLEILLRAKTEIDPRKVFYTEGCSFKCRGCVYFIGFWILKFAFVLSFNLILCPCLIKLLNATYDLYEPITVAVQTEPDETKKEQEAFGPEKISTFENNLFI